MMLMNLTLAKIPKGFMTSLKQDLFMKTVTGVTIVTIKLIRKITIGSLAICTGDNIMIFTKTEDLQGIDLMIIIDLQIDTNKKL